jgi:hypothetical protein
MRTEVTAETVVAVVKCRGGASRCQDERTFAGRPEGLVTGCLAAEGRLPWFAHHVWTRA